MEEMYDPTLGRRLAVCKANPGTLFIFAIPGLYGGTRAAEGRKQAETEGIPAGMGQEEPPLHHSER